MLSPAGCVFAAPRLLCDNPVQVPYSFVSRPFTQASAFVHRRIVLLRKLAYCSSVVGVVAVGVAVALAAADSSQQKVVLAILGGTIAATPYMIARALEEVVRDETARESGSCA